MSDKYTELLKRNYVKPLAVILRQVQGVADENGDPMHIGDQIVEVRKICGAQRAAIRALENQVDEKSAAITHWQLLEQTLRRRIAELEAERDRLRKQNRKLKQDYRNALGIPGPGYGFPR